MDAGSYSTGAYSITIGRNASHLPARAWNESCTFGQYDIRRVDTCRESTTLQRLFSRYSCRHTSVMRRDELHYHSSDDRTMPDSDPEGFDPSVLPPNVLDAVEADTFWCLSRLLDGIQDNYIATQPGIHRSVKRMTELVARIDGTSYIAASREDEIFTIRLQRH